MCRKFIINQYFPPTRFIQYGNFYSITKSGTAIYKDNINILNKCIISDFIVRNVFLDAGFVVNDEANDPDCLVFKFTM